MANLDAVFKAYDIRGRTPDELDSRLAHDIGRAFADWLPAGSVAVGRDMRLDSGSLAQGFIAGLQQQGRRVVDIGQCTSDMVYFAVGSMELAGGAMITASHNAAGFNGIKLTAQGVVPVGQDSGLMDIKHAVAAQTFKIVEGMSELISQDLVELFVQHALELVKRNYGPVSPLAIGYDAGNGMAGIMVGELCNQAGLQIDGIYLEPDGNFPHHPANPADPKNMVELQRLVTGQHLRLGVAFDGDGDRIFIVDDQGQLVSASVFGALLASKTLIRHPGAAIVYGVNCSQIVPDTITAGGGKAVVCRVGHSFMKEKMRSTGAMLGIERAGHFYFADNYFADSGLIAALSAVAFISQTNQPMSELLAPFARYADSPELNFPLGDFTVLQTNLKRQFADGEFDDTDGLRVQYPDWWFNVRPSNTEPYVRLVIEARDPATLEAKTELLQKLLTEQL